MRVLPASAGILALSAFCSGAAGELAGAGAGSPAQPARPDTLQNRRALVPTEPSDQRWGPGSVAASGHRSSSAAPNCRVSPSSPASNENFPTPYPAPLLFRDEALAPNTRVRPKGSSGRGVGPPSATTPGRASWCQGAPLGLSAIRRTPLNQAPTWKRALASGVLLAAGHSGHVKGGNSRRRLPPFFSDSRRSHFLPGPGFVRSRNRKRRRITSALVGRIAGAQQPPSESPTPGSHPPPRRPRTVRPASHATRRRLYQCAGGRITKLILLSVSMLVVAPASGYRIAETNTTRSPLFPKPSCSFMGSLERQKLPIPAEMVLKAIVYHARIGRRARTTTRVWRRGA